MALPRNYLPPNRRGRVYPTLKAFFHRQKRGSESNNGNGNQTLARAKKIGFQSRYLLQNRLKNHKQLIKVREILYLNSVHVRYDVQAVVWPKKLTKNECRER
jgi:hypothetical protein